MRVLAAWVLSILLSVSCIALYERTTSQEPSTQANGLECIYNCDNYAEALETL